MGTRSDPDIDRPADPDGEDRIPEGQPPPKPADEPRLRGLDRHPDLFNQASPRRPEGYLIFHQAHGT